MRLSSVPKLSSVPLLLNCPPNSLIRVLLFVRVLPLLSVPKEAFTSVPLFTKEPKLLMKPDPPEFVTVVGESMVNVAGPPTVNVLRFVKLTSSPTEPLGMEISVEPSGTTFRLHAPALLHRGMGCPPNIQVFWAAAGRRRHKNAIPRIEILATTAPTFPRRRSPNTTARPPPNRRK